MRQYIGRMARKKKKNFKLKIQEIVYNFQEHPFWGAPT